MKHELRMKVLSSDVTKQGVFFTLHDENGKSGTLEIRPGSITWYSGTKAPKNKCVVNWAEFDVFMREHKAK